MMQSQIYLTSLTKGSRPSRQF
ncbi:hypothetical protein Golob_024899 [Gossypium lobatum]|uniref:Uncharacterized protein n=1 Tax=Gossypium lobatum TaxID=34289 RepID=A0A7J8NH76_9ROSI|nr:hypothetical protein [Gossypium lobatum]